MKIGIYGPYFGTMGGGELYLGTLAEILSRYNEVQIVSETEISLERYAALFGLDLSGVSVRVVPRIPFVESLNPLSKSRQDAYEAATEFTADYEVFILMPRNFRIPFRTLSRYSILHLQVPERPWEWSDFAKALARGRFAEFRNQIVKRFEYPHRYAEFDAVLINSEFHRDIIQKRLRNPNAVVLPPPIQLKAATAWDRKESIILSVGRFFRGLHSKRHDVLIAAFRKFAASHPDWTLALAGGMSDEPSAREYFNELQQAARGLRVKFHPNIALNDLNELYAKARIYWHASGFGADRRSPEQMEHFGISTVEAMSAGCIPVVYRAGGQVEIVQDAINGRFWSSEPELIALTKSVLGDPGAAKMSEAAIARSRTYGRDRFEQRLQNALKHIGEM